MLRGLGGDICIVTFQPLCGLLAPLCARKVHLSQTRIFARMLIAAFSSSSARSTIAACRP